MRSRKAKPELRRFLKARGLSSTPRTPREAVDAMFAFYREIRTEDCQGGDHDMLLFQWGTYDCGEGLVFEFDLARQFIADGDDEDSEPWQLHVTFRFPPTPELGGVVKGNRWCHDLGELPAFRGFILASPAYVAVADRTDGEFELLHECAG